MSKLTPEQQLAQIDEARQRWQRRLTRATNTLSKLEKKRRRLANQILARDSENLPVIATVRVRKPAPPKAMTGSEVLLMLKAEADAEQKALPAPPKSDDLDIPLALLRGKGSAIDKAVEEANERIAEAKRKDAEAAAAIKAEADERRRKKAKGRVERMKAKQRGDLARMPLTGKAALEAIRRGAR